MSSLDATGKTFWTCPALQALRQAAAPGSWLHPLSRSNS